MRLFLVSCFAAALSAQTIEISSLTNAAPLAGVWKEQPGDDPRWSPAALLKGLNRALWGQIGLISHGVVDAATRAGERFGFERARLISGLTHQQIAEHGKSLGSEWRYHRGYAAE
jgi:hypothetical protein